MEKATLQDFAMFTGRSLFLNKVAGLSPTIFLKKRLQQRCFPVNTAKFLRMSFLKNTCERLLLHPSTDGFKIFEKSVQSVEKYGLLF